MKWHSSLLIVISIILFCASCSWPFFVEKNTRQRFTTNSIASCIRDLGCQKKFVVAHRGLGFGAPENSRETVRRAVAAGVPIIEIDVRKSLDGELFVLHDSRLDRTTNARGHFVSKTKHELATVFLKNGETIPTLAEIYDIARGRAILYLDIKGGVVQETANWIAQHGSWDDAIFCVNGKDEISDAARAKSQYPPMIVAAQAYSPKNLALVKQYFPRLPEIIDIGFPTPRKALWLPKRTKIYASSLVLEIGLPFLKPFWLLYMNTWSFDLLETNNSPFWMRWTDNTHQQKASPPTVIEGVFL